MKKIFLSLFFFILFLSFTNADLQNNWTFTGDDLTCSVTGLTAWVIGDNADCDNEYFESASGEVSYTKEIEFPTDKTITINADVYFEDIGNGRRCNFGIANISTGTSYTEQYLYMQFNEQSVNIPVFTMGNHLGTFTGFTPVSDTWTPIEFNLHTNGTLDMTYLGSYRGAIETGLQLTELTKYPILHAWSPGIEACYWDNIAFSWDEDVEPELTVNTDLINNTINFNEPNLTIGFNGSFENTDSDFFNCSLKNNETFLINETELNLSDNQFFVFNTTEIDDNFYFNIYCEQNGIVNDTTDLFFYEIDTINVIQLSDFINETIFLDSDSFRFYTNFSDTNLDWYLINISNSQNIIWNFHDYFIENLSVSFAENLTLDSFDSGDVENYTIIVRAGDSHNPKKEPHEKYNDIITIGNTTTIFFDNGYLSITDSNIEEYELESSENKYKEKIKFKERNGFMIFESNKNIRLVDSKYSGHIIIREMKKFKDFESKDFTIIEIKQINNYSVSIEYESEEEIELNSIGDLNEIISIYYFSVIETPTLSDLLLTDINSSLTNLNETNQLISNGVNMIWFWFLFVVGLIVPTALKEKLEEQSYIIGAIIFSILFLFLLTYDFGLSVLALNLLRIVMVVLIFYSLAETQKTGSGQNSHF